MIETKYIKDVLDNFGATVVGKAQRNLGATRVVNGKRRRIDSSGRLRKSLNHNVRVGKNGSFEFYIEAEHYAKYVDKGRKPGKGIPIKAMNKWIKEKPIRLRNPKTKSFEKVTPSKLRSLSYLLNRKIREEGIAATNFLSEPFEEEFKNLPPELLEAYALSVDEFFEFALKE